MKQQLIQQQLQNFDAAYRFRIQSSMQRCLIAIVGLKECVGMRRQKTLHHLAMKLAKVTTERNCKQAVLFRVKTVQFTCKMEWTRLPHILLSDCIIAKQYPKEFQERTRCSLNWGDIDRDPVGKEKTTTISKLVKWCFLPIILCNCCLGEGFHNSRANLGKNLGLGKKNGHSRCRCIRGHVRGD